MDFLTVLTLAGMLAFIGVTIFVANQEQADGKAPTLSHLLLYLVLAMMFLLAPSAYFLTTEPDYAGTPELLGLAVALVAAGVIASYAVVSSPAFQQTLRPGIPAAWRLREQYAAVLCRTTSSYCPGEESWPSAASRTTARLC